MVGAEFLTSWILAPQAILVPAAEGGTSAMNVRDQCSCWSQVPCACNSGDCVTAWCLQPAGTFTKVSFRPRLDADVPLGGVIS